MFDAIRYRQEAGKCLRKAGNGFIGAAELVGDSRGVV
jgi:hypothetical protein